MNEFFIGEWSCIISELHSWYRIEVVRCRVAQNNGLADTVRKVPNFTR